MHSVPSSNSSTSLITVHFVDCFDSFIFSNGRVFNGVCVSSREYKNRAACGHLLDTRVPSIKHFILASRYDDLRHDGFRFASANTSLDNRFRFFERYFNFLGLFTGDGGFLFNRPQLDFGRRRKFTIHCRVPFILSIKNRLLVHGDIEGNSVVAGGIVGVVGIFQSHLVITSFQVSLNLFNI